MLLFKLTLHKELFSTKAIASQKKKRKKERGYDTNATSYSSYTTSFTWDQNDSSSSILCTNK